MKITVKMARCKAGLTQDEMAEKMGLHVQTYRKIEKNPQQTTIEQGIRIAEITGCGFDDIFFGNDSTLSR